MAKQRPRLRKDPDPSVRKHFRQGRIPYDAGSLIRLLRKFPEDKPGTVAEVCHHLGITSSYFFRLFEDIQEFEDVVMEIRARADDRVESAMYKRAVGYEFEERSEMVRTGKDKDGNDIEEERVTVSNKHVAPDTGAQMNWLKTRRRDDWDKAQKVEISAGAGWGAMLNAMREDLDE